MLFSRRWLAEYVELPPDAAGLAQRLTMGGFAVERFEASPGNDTVLDVDVTSNRPDCMCHLGLGREIAVLLGRPLAPPEVRLREAAEKAEGATAVSVEDAAGCPQYVARLVAGVRIGPSPEWLRDRLDAIGVRPINNVVDATNFVLWEMGQPLHAYDLAQLAGRQIVVRRARAGERLVTLDGVERELDPEVLVIADAARPVGIAGIMGGRDSEVTAGTTELLLEGAHFDRRAVRTAARRLGMHTDASHRFERGTDPEGCAPAVARAAALIAELAGGRVLAGAVVQRSAPAPRRHGRLELARLIRFAGAHVTAAEVERILGGLGFGLTPTGVTAEGATAWDVRVPTWRLFDFEPRPDGTVYEADLFEEVLRIVGFDRIPAALPALAGSDGGRTPLQRARDRARGSLAGAGYAEAINFGFLDPQADAALPCLRPGTAPLVLANPLSERYSVLRRSLVPGLVENARLNRRRGAAAVRLFEIASVFFAAGDPGSGLPDQPEHVGLVCGGRLGSPWDREVDLDSFDLKGAVEGLAEDLGTRLAARPAALPGLVAGNAAELLLAGADATGEGASEVIGYLGRVDGEEGFPLFVAEISLSALAGRDEALVFGRVAIPSRYPGVSADLTLTHARAIPWSEIERAIAGGAPAELVSFRLKDRYSGPGVPADAVNSTITFLYNAGDRSLTQEEVNTRQRALAGELEKRFGWRA
jgi:phenylalanyl-tRNA synthetase beta chain